MGSNPATPTQSLSRSEGTSEVTPGSLSILHRSEGAKQGATGSGGPRLVLATKDGVQSFGASGDQRLELVPVDLPGHRGARVTVPRGAARRGFMHVTLRGHRRYRETEVRGRSGRHPGPGGPHSPGWADADPVASGLRHRPVPRRRDRHDAEGVREHIHDGPSVSDRPSWSRNAHRPRPIKPTAAA